MNAAFIIFVKECRESLRDKRVLLNALVLGPLLGPLIFVVILRAVIGRELDQADQPLPVTVIGAQYAPNLIEALKQQGLVLQAPVADVEAAVKQQRTEVALKISDTYAQDWQAGRPAQVDIIYDSSRRDSGSKIQRLRNMLSLYTRRTSVMRLVARGISPAVGTPLLIGDRDQATAQARGALMFAMLPYFLILTSFLGGMWLAIDATAGERERQSLEPLLANPVPRSQILLGKLLAAAAFSFTSLTLGLIAFAIAAHFVPTEQLEMSLNLGPIFIATILPIMVPLIFVIVITQIIVSAFAKTYREAQTYLGLLQLLPVIPSVLLSVLPVTPKLWMYAIPLIGQQLAMMNLLRTGVIEINPLLLCTATTMIALVALFLVAQRIYGSERLAINA